MRLSGQVGMVTGGGRGIGAAIAKALSREGMAVGIVARTESQVAETVAEIEAAGGRATGVIGDIASPADVKGAVSHLVAALGPIDLLVNNAGRGPTTIGPLWECDTEDWWAVLSVNLLGPVLTCRAVLPAMVSRGSGRVVNIGSLTGARPWGVGSSYAVSKAALMRLTDSLAESLEGTDVHVFEVNPGLVRTALVESQKELFSEVPDSAFSSPEVAAGAVVRIASGELDPLHGRVLTAGDHFEDMLAQVELIRELDARTLRLRTYGELDPLTT